MIDQEIRGCLLTAILESSEDAILSYGPDGIVQSWSRGAESIYGYAAADILGTPVTRLMPLDEVNALESILNGIGYEDFGKPERSKRLHKNGSKLCLAVKRKPLRDDQGEITEVVEIGEPLLRPAEGDGMAETQLRLLVEQMPVVLWTTDQDLRITSNWGSALRLASIRAGELVGQTVFDYLESEDPHTTPIKEHYEALRGISGHFEYLSKGRTLDVRLEPLRSPSGSITGCIGVGVDITERKRTEDQIRYQATHDALTGLANYREFVDTLEREVKRAERSRHSFALLFLDLNDLKRINDRLGHLAGNRALKRLASVLKQHCRSTDVPARYGGDEFAAVLLDADPGMAAQIAGRIERCLKNDREDPPLSVSTGISVYPGDGRSAQELIEAADRELYRRKKNKATVNLKAATR